MNSEIQGGAVNFLEPCLKDVRLQEGENGANVDVLR